MKQELFLITCIGVFLIISFFAEGTGSWLALYSAILLAVVGFFMFVI